MKKAFTLLLLMISLSIFAQKIKNIKVDAGCGMCQFKLKAIKDCVMAVKYKGKIYPLEGLKDESFGDAHANDGYCNMTRKAIVSGEIKNGKFYATIFSYVK